MSLSVDDMISPHAPMPASPLLEVRGITKSFGSVSVLKNVSFSLNRGEVLAIMGENGAGKSTLMNILSGVLPRDGGEVRVEGKDVFFRTPAEAHRAGVAMVHQELHLVPELSVAENIFLGREPTTTLGVIDRKTLNERASRLLERLSCQLAPHIKVNELRVAEQQMIEIAKALAFEARLLILDEPTAALSEVETAELFKIIDVLRKEGVGILYISHRMDEIFKIADHVLVLRDGTVVSQTPAQSLNRQALIRDMVGQDVTEFFADHRKPAQDIMLRVDNLSRRDGAGRNILSDISFDVRRGEILGIAGLLGSGRTELLEILAGVCADSCSGVISLNGKRLQFKSPAQAIAGGVAYITEDRKGSGLVLSQSIADNIALASLEKLSHLGIMKDARARALAQESMTSLAIHAQSASQLVSTLSGGNQQKVVIGKWLATKPQLLLLDEPTRGVDVGAKAAIYEILNEFAQKGHAQILVSSDWLELMALSDRILVLQSGKPAALFERSEYSQSLLLDYATAGGPVQPRFSLKAAS